MAATIIDSNSTPLERKHGHSPTDIQAKGLPTDIIDRIPTLSPKEGLGSSHSVSVGLVAQSLNSQEAFERAKRDAECDGIGTVERIHEYGITDQNMLFEIAKLILQQEPDLVNDVVKEFKISDQIMLFELAKIVYTSPCLEVNVRPSFAFVIGKITEQNMLFEIAKLLVQQDPHAIIGVVRKFKITDQSMLSELVKIYVTKPMFGNYMYVEGLISTIEKFGITDQSLRCEILKIFISHGHANELSGFCKVLSLVDQEHHTLLLQLYFDRIFFDLALTCEDLIDMVSEPEKIDESKKRLFSLAKAFNERSPPYFENAEQKAKVEKQLREVKDFAISLGASCKILESLEEIFIKGRHNLQQQKKDRLWLCGLVMHYALDQTLPQSPLCDEGIIPLLKCIGKITDPLMRRDATNALIAIYHDPDKKKDLKSLLARKEERHYLFILFSVSLGLEQALTIKIVEELGATKYKDAAVMASIHQMMSALGKSSLPDMKKEQLMQIIFNPPAKKNGEKQPEYQKRLEDYRKNQRNAIAAVNSLFYFGQDQILLEVTDTTTLVSRWQTYMGQVFEIKSDNLSDFIPTFSRSKRRPNGLMTYAARLQTLPKEDKKKLMPLLGKFASAVLDGTFHQMRYDISNNQHMQALFSGNGDLLKKWQTSLPIKIEGTSVSGETTSPQERVQKLMRDALDNHHLGKEGTEEIEGLCQTVLNPKTDLPQLQVALESLQKLFPDPASEFHHDLKVMMAALTAQESSAKKWVIEDTDAWEDLLLMGTEPDNSCQHIERDPQFNKCVIGAIWDPKIRLMVARDSESGKILGRVVYRILLPKREIFVERLYIRNGINIDEAKRDILEGCRQKAEVMGSNLVASTNDYGNLSDKRYPVTLHSLGSPAPYEYVDALSGIQKDGVYSLNNNVVLWSPSS